MPSLSRNAVVAGIMLAAFTAPAWGHAGELLEPHDLWTAWEFNPGVVIPLALSAFLYWRGSDPAHGIRQWESAIFWAGWFTLFTALCSPVHRLGEILFSAHMVQHELIMLVAAPLMVLGRPVVAFLWALPIEWRRAMGSASKTHAFETLWGYLTRPAFATFLAGITLWVWHAPPLYQATLTSETIHALQHLSFLATSLLFWWALLRGHEGRAGYGAAVLYLFATLMHSSALGALFTFGTGVFYPAYKAAAMKPWGVTPEEDQIIAGLIMWVPAGLVYVGAALALCSAYLNESDRRADFWLSTLMPRRAEDSAL